jgi:hypothetical protein
VAEGIRKPGISEQTFYRSKAKYAGLEVNQVRQMGQLQEENLAMPPSQAAKLALLDAVVRRGFRGELHHVRHGSELIRIRSGETGVDLREEA